MHDMSHLHTHHRNRRKPGSILLALVLAGIAQSARSQIVADDFNRPDNPNVENGWVETESASPGSTAITSNGLMMYANAAGSDFIAKATPGAYSTVLAGNSCLLTWQFNMRTTRLNPNGFNAGAFGNAVVLAASHADLRQGVGYAVVLGTASSTIDPLRLVRYNGGLDADANLTTIAAYGDFGSEYLSVMVTFEQATNAWKMYVASSSSSFPAMPSGGAAAASGTDAMYTSQSLPYVGCYYNHGATASEKVRFDNLRLPYDCSTRFDFTMSEMTVSESAGTFSVPVQITNPSPLVDSWVDVQLLAGDASRISGFSSATLHFVGPNAAIVELALQAVPDGACTGEAWLELHLANPIGGQGTVALGPQSVLTLVIDDDNRTEATLLSESFETDGAGSRYALSTAHAAPAANAYFMRGTAAELSALGCVSATGMNDQRLIAAENLSAMAPNGEATISFNPIDIRGVSGIVVSLLAGARNGNAYDRVAAERDHLLVETRIDGGAWTIVGAFRASGAATSTNKPLRLDSDLDGQGDGPTLTPALQPFVFPVAVSGEQLEARLRFRTNSSGEELLFDQVMVEGTRCRPTYYSRASGSTSDAVWSNLRDGIGENALWNDYTASFVVQAGHTVTAGAPELLARNLTIESGASFDLDTATLELRGDQLHASGPFMGIEGVLSIRSDERIQIDGPATYELNNVNVAATEGTDVLARWEVHGTLQLEVGDFNALDGNVILRSTEERTGRLGPVPAGVSYLGKMKVERYVPGGVTNWRLLGSPVAGNKVLHWQDDFYTAGYPGSHYPGFLSNGNPWPSIRYDREELTGPNQNDGLVGVTSSDMPLEMGQGFTAWSGDNFTTTAPFVVDLRGEPNIATTPIVLPLTYTDHDLGSDGWNLVSNPLPSAIDFGMIVRSEDVVNQYWIFNPANGNMASWNGEEGINGANGIIQSSQGFWVRTKGPDVTMTVAEDAKVDDNSGGLFGGSKSLRQPSYVRLRLNSGINNFSDETLVFFHAGTPAADPEDVPKLVFSHPQAPQLATMAETGQWIAMNAYGPIGSDFMIPLVVNVAVTGDYTITATEITSLGLSCLRIEDLETGAITPLDQGIDYTFTMAAEADPNTIRFRLLGSAPLPLALHEPICAGFDDGSASVTLTGAATVTWAHAAGATIAQSTGAASETVSLDGLTAGDYVLTVAPTDGCATMTAPFTMAEPAPLMVEAEITDATCSGTTNGSIELTTSGGTAPYTVSWSNGASAAAMLAGPGEYSATIADANGCTLAWGPQAIAATGQAEAVAAGPISPVQVLLPISFSSLGSVGSEYHWDFGDGTTSVAPDAEHYYEVPGTYQVVLTVSDAGCTATAQIEVVVETTTGLSSAATNGFMAWFAHDHVVIANDRESATLAHVEILSANGQLHTVHRVNGVRGRLLIPASGLAPGAWFARITDDKGTRALPFVVAE